MGRRLVHLSAWDRLLHFTWWGILSRAEPALCCVSPLADFHLMCASRLWSSPASFTCLCECDMLVDAHASLGTAPYAAGNFFIHYTPCSAFSRSPPARPTPTPLALWLVYNTVAAASGHPPNDTYGCEAPPSVVIATGSFAAAAASLLHAHV